jgi:hypothetical protein
LRISRTSAGDCDVNDALKNSDLNELAGSDVRAFSLDLSAQPQLLSNDLVRVSAVGKAFIEYSAPWPLQAERYDREAQSGDFSKERSGAR